MRVSLRALAAVGFLSFTGADCCGVGAPELVPERGACASFYECSIAVDGRVTAVSTYPASRVVAVDVDPPELLTVVLDGERLQLRARLAGEGRVRAAYTDGGTAETWITTAPIADTRVVPVDEGVPPGPIAIYRGGELRVAAEHLDERGQRMMGDGLETWAIDGGTLREVRGDTGPQRIVVAGDGDAASVTARPGTTPLALDIMRPGATARLALTVGTLPLTDERVVVLRSGASAVVGVLPLAEDGRRIHGLPTLDGLEASSSNAGVTAEVVRERREVTLRALAAGEGEVEVKLDGQVVRFRVVSN